MDSSEEIQEGNFSSDTEFDDEDNSESSTDIDAKLEEDDVFDVEFFKCYSALKKKDEKIYDENVRFFTDRDVSDSENEAKKKISAPKMTLLDHQLSLKEGDIEEPELERPVKVDLNKPVSKSFYDKELEEIKKSIEKVSENIDSESDDDLLIVKGSDGKESRPKSKKTISSILDKLEGEEDEDISHLKKVWSDSDNLTTEEKYLRDYILNKRYLPAHANDSDEDDKDGFFSRNLDELSDTEAGPEEAKKLGRQLPAYHSDEKDFEKIARIPRNSTKTIRDLVEKRDKKEKRQKKLEKEKRKKKSLKDADFEDIVGDMPTRFHYRETEPNDYGLSAQELLMATDEELDQWISLKDAIAYKTKEEELAQKRKYESKRDDLELKRKIFKSIYGDPIATPEDKSSASKSTSKKKRRRHTDSEGSIEIPHVSHRAQDAPNHDGSGPPESTKKSKKKKRRGLNHKIAKVGVAPDRLLAYGLSKTKLKKSKLL